MYKKKGFSSYSFGIDTKIDLYVDKTSHNEVSIPLIKNYRNKNI